MDIYFKKVWIFSVLIIGIQCTASEYCIPHMTSQNPWVNKIVIFNTGTVTKDCSLTVWNSEGEESETVSFSVNSYDKTEVVMTSYSSYVSGLDNIILDSTEGTCILITEDDCLVPVLSYQYGNSESISQFFLNDGLSEGYLLPNVHESHFDWTGIAVMNQRDNDLLITFSAYQDGTLRASDTVTVNPMCKFVDITETMWGGLELNDFDQIIVSADQTFPAPVLITGNNAQDRHVFFSGIPVDLSESNEVQGTLFAPLNATTTYLINSNGETIHLWESNYRPGNSVYLLEDGSLLRTGNVRNMNFNTGGAGGVVQKISWNNQVEWEYQYSSDDYLQHHDIEMLPNGNILMIAWQKITKEEALEAGRNLSLVTENGLWVDSIIEIKPSGLTGGDVIWAWYLMDHLVQNNDPSGKNYGVVSEYPERVDFNYAKNSNADWTHVNSVDYNAELDQIIISIHNFNEVWIIDHSTTMDEAAGNTGGTWGKGGDLLYRWGNPEAYDRGTDSDQVLFSQHDAKWIPEGCPGEGHILIFNNGGRRPEGNYSSIEEVELPVESDGSYFIQTGEAYGPESVVWHYQADNPTEFYAENISGSQRLTNGNTLICDGPAGVFFEVNEFGETVWEYTYGSAVFRAENYNLNNLIYTKQGGE